MNTSSVLFREQQEGHNGFNLTVKNLMVWVPEEKKFGNETPKKAILKGVNAEFKEGTVTAIVGPSGSGKTTFLNFLAGRQDTSQMFLTYCDYYLNGTKIENVNEFKNIIGYVTQEDIMENRNTPRQIFEYYAKLRGYADPKKKAGTIIDTMYLRKCADTVVGSVFVRGLSGGEKKRTSIGIELVSNPNLLFLDEPTTGLDSTTALDIITNIVELKKKGMTVICTIHQPSEEIMALFDKIIMLVDGNLIYDMEPHSIVPHLEKLNFHKTEFETGIEFFMKIVDKDDIKIFLLEKYGKIDPEQVQIVFDQRIGMLLSEHLRLKAHIDDNYVENPELIKELKQLASTKNQQIGMFSQIATIYKYYTILFFKDFMGVVLKSILLYTVFILCIIVFVKTPTASENPVNAIQGKAGYFFMIAVFYFFTGSAASGTLILPAQQIFKKDQQARLHSSFTYFMALWTHIMPFYFVNISIVSVASFFIFKLNFGPQSNLAWFWAFNNLSFIGGTSMGLLISAISNRLDDIGTFTPIIVLPMLTVTGFFINIFNITWPLRIYSYISTLRFLFQGFIMNEFQDNKEYVTNCILDFDCLHNPSKTCSYPIPPGTEFTANCDPFNRFNFEQTEVWKNFVISVALTLGWAILAFVVFILRYKEKTAIYSFDQELFDKYAKKKQELPELQLNKQLSFDPRMRKFSSNKEDATEIMALKSTENINNRFDI